MRPCREWAAGADLFTYSEVMMNEIAHEARKLWQDSGMAVLDEEGVPSLGVLVGVVEGV